MTVWFYPIDWAATGAWMQAWAGFAGAAAVIWVARIGASTFDEWIRQRQTERKIAAAERIMTLLYKAKDVFPALRSAGMLGYESSAAEEKLNMRDLHTRPRGRGAV